MTVCITLLFAQNSKYSRPVQATCRPAVFVFTVASIHTCMPNITKLILKPDHDDLIPTCSCCS